MWSVKTRHIVQKIKFELLVSYENLNDTLVRTFYLGLLWYWYRKLLMLGGCQKQRIALELCCLFPLFCSFSLCDMWWVFSDHITNGSLMSLIIETDIFTCFVLYFNRDEDSCPFGPLTQRLISALVEENIMTPLEDIIMESTNTKVGGRGKICYYISRSVTLLYCACTNGWSWCCIPLCFSLFFSRSFAEHDSFVNV